MSSEEVVESVRSWLNQHGYVLEMEVAQELMSHCPYVLQGEQYSDPVTGKLRETDVYASWGDTPFQMPTYHDIAMVIECKSTVAPWVAFFGGSLNSGDDVLPYFYTGPLFCERCNLIENSMLNIAAGIDSPIAYAVTEKRSKKADRDHAREAVLAVTSAAISTIEIAEKNSKNHPKHFSYLGLPVVVTNSPIVACSLDEDGKVRLSPIEKCWVSSTHEKRDAPMSVLLITHKEFKSFVKEFGAMCREIGIG